MNKKIFVATYGCPKNDIDSEGMQAILAKKEGFFITENPQEAEIIIINTCGFILDAQEESINAILEFAEFKKENCIYLIVVGCLVQRYHCELVEELPEVDAFLGTDQYHEIYEVIKELETKNKRNHKLSKEISDFYREQERFFKGDQSYAYLRIAEGCSNHCTYCTIPFIRGKYRSRKKENIIKEAKLLANRGISEIIIIAQDTSYYGKENGSQNELAELLRALAAIEGIKWLRLMYCYPNNLDNELIALFAEEEKICKYLDLPLQHISDKVLQRMGRGIDSNKIKSLLNSLRKEVPGVVIRTTFIVGFPGESEEDFAALLDFLQEFRLERVGFFPYSAEEGTAAMKLKPHLDEETILLRLNLAMQTQEKILLDIHRERLGKNIIVKIDKYLEEEKLYVARSEGEAPEIDPAVYIFSEQPLNIGGYYSVKITHLEKYDFIGEIVCEFA